MSDDPTAPAPILPWRPNPRPSRGPSQRQIQSATLRAERDEDGLSISLETPCEVVDLDLWQIGALRKKDEAEKG